ncbi:signaling lymphocytic activation molecule [Oryctolagus cuniculus]|uniref:Signaling lymphocytic activation molecule n=1 Tax=Oryctolagus cuniculus TaxID=9986 RepID=G1U3Y0_RABIT|nr:signaling lymphocytic activation molecule [Oryctolagus cuniculus]
MDTKGYFSWSLLLVLSLAFGLSYVAGRGVMDCPKSVQQLGSNILLPLTNERINKSMNKSIRIVVTVAKSPESSVKRKIVSLDLSEGGSPEYVEDGYRFHPEDLKLGLLESRKEHEGWYFLSLEENTSVQQFCVQLSLYEQVSTPEIKVLNRTQENENGTCSLMLACTVEKGDHVAYNWSKKEGLHPLGSANSSHLLHLTLGPQHADNIYNCTVSNPVSSRSQAFNPWSICRSDSSGSRQWGLYAGLFLGGIVVAIMVLEVVILLSRRRGKANHYQSTMEEKSLTIYAQVQKSGPLQKTPETPVTQDPCTTIYVAAAEPVPESVQEPNPITVYASVTLPES